MPPSPGLACLDNWDLSLPRGCLDAGVTHPGSAGVGEDTHRGKARGHSRITCPPIFSPDGLSQDKAVHTTDMKMSPEPCDKGVVSPETCPCVFYLPTRSADVPVTSCLLPWDRTRR